MQQIKSTTEQATEAKGWFSHERPAHADPEPSAEYNAAQLAAAVGSVRALVADLRYIMGEEPVARWSTLASAALHHHSPAIPDERLDVDYRDLQQAGRAALVGLRQGSFSQIRDAVLEIRQLESRL